MLLGCSGTNGDYERIDESVYYKLIVPGDEFSNDKWEVVSLYIEPGIRKYHRLKPLLILRKDLGSHAVDQKLAVAVPGDSMVFVSSGTPATLGALNGYVLSSDTVRIKVLAKRTIAQQKSHEQGVIDSMELMESREIQQWLKELNIDDADRLGQVFILDRATDSTHLKVVCDTVVSIHYKGMLQNGNIVDVSDENGFEYKVCTPGQLVPGIVSLVKDSRKGDKLKIILPSHLAFGMYGSNDGKVPPFTPILYELQIE